MKMLLYNKFYIDCQYQCNPFQILDLTNTLKPSDHTLTMILLACRDLSNNAFTGEIPDSLPSLPSLKSV